MKTKNLIDYNNKLREELSEKNNKKYEELLVKIRLIGFFKNQEKVEETLLEMLQDLIKHQKNGKNFEDIFGNDIDSLAKNIVENSSKDSFLKNLNFILSIVMMFFLPSFFINLVGIEYFDLVKYILSGAIIVIIILSSVYLLTRTFYEKNKIISLMILSIMVFLVLLTSPLIINYNIIDIGVSYYVKVTPTILIISYFASILSIIYAGISLNEIKLFSTLSIVPTIFAIIAILNKNNLNNVKSNKNLLIVYIILIILGLLLTLLLGKKFSKTKK